jgi:nucleotide-binding universal stress UspA family protein
VDAPRQRIVVGVDGSTGARAALAWSLTEAARRGADLEVLAAFAIDYYWADPYLVDARRIHAVREDTEVRARAAVHEVRAELTSVLGVEDVDVAVLVVPGTPSEHLVQRSEAADLLVVGSRGRGAVRSTLAGSVALHCSVHARCPVVVVHDAPAGRTGGGVVVGLDDSEPARAALRAAVRQASPIDARVTAVLAYGVPDEWSDLHLVMGESAHQATVRGERLVAEALADDAEQRDAVRVRAIEGSPGPVLVRTAEGASLLVVGCRSRNQLQGVLLGSAALYCVLHAGCPVMVVRPRSHTTGGTSARSIASSAPAAG